MDTYLTLLASLWNDLLPEKDFGQDTVFFRLVLASVIALIVALVLSRLITRALPHVAELITSRIASSEKSGDKLLQVRRTETFLNLFASVGRVLIMVLCLYIAWRAVNPTSAPLAVIGAGTIFFVIGAATVGPILRDVTSGILMVAERWYDVGDHIVVDPFWELSGIVEAINLRSTKLRTLTGEIVWMHNQHIQAVRVTPRGLRTISLDTFVDDRERGRELLESVFRTLPTGPTMIATPLTIREEEQLGDVWRITAIGQTSPGREWLIKDFVVESLIKADKRLGKDAVIRHGPIIRYTDASAEKRFLRSMQGAEPKARKKPKE